MTFRLHLQNKISVTMYYLNYIHNYIFEFTAMVNLQVYFNFPV